MFIVKKFQKSTKSAFIFWICQGINLKHFRAALKMESGYVSREVSPSRQSTVPGPINIEHREICGDWDNLQPVSGLQWSGYKALWSSSHYLSSNTKGSYLTCECRNRRGTFILSYIINCSTVKHIVIPHSYKARKLLKIEDLLPEVFSVIESIDVCLISLVPTEDDVTKDVNV